MLITITQGRTKVFGYESAAGVRRRAKGVSATAEYIWKRADHTVRVILSGVALSRAASLDGLQVLGFDPKKVCALGY